MFNYIQPLTHAIDCWKFDTHLSQEKRIVVDGGLMTNSPVRVRQVHPPFLGAVVYLNEPEKVVSVARSVGCIGSIFSYRMNYTNVRLLELKFLFYPVVQRPPNRSLQVQFCFVFLREKRGVFSFQRLFFFMRLFYFRRLKVII